MFTAIYSQLLCKSSLNQLESSIHEYLNLWNRMEEKIQKFSQTLAKYMPEASARWGAELVVHHKVFLKITRSRNTKLGDYRWPQKDEGHVITINHDLNPYAFLITFTHEFAHLLCWEKHKNNVLPHGNEWQAEFASLLRQLMNMNVFPEDIKNVLLHRGESLKASSCTDPMLMKVLRRYDPDKGTHLLHEIPHNSLFVLKNGEVFRKGEKRRTRYHCVHVHSNRGYLVSAIAEVKRIN
jgi:predicted SprT family Zn-dependent metalloprotease